MFDDLPQLGDRNRHQVRTRLLQEAKLELIQLKWVHLVHDKVRGKALVSTHRHRVKTLDVLEVLRETAVQEG